MISGTNTNYSVSCDDSDKAAGRFVGSMLEGSELNVTTDVPGFLANNAYVTGKKYAGGIVGYCHKGNVSFKDSNDNDLSANAYGYITTVHNLRNNINTAKNPMFSKFMRFVEQAKI